MNKPDPLTPVPLSNMRKMMSLADHNAAITGRCCWVFRIHDHLDYCYNFMPGWLYKSYPGGRKQLSIEGKALIESTKEKNQ